MVAAGIDGRFQKIEMDRGHLGAKDGVILSHFFGKENPVVGAGNHLAAVLLLIPHPEGGNQGTDADPGGSQVIYLIDL